MSFPRTYIYKQKITWTVGHMISRNVAPSAEKARHASKQSLVTGMKHSNGTVRFTAYNKHGHE